MQKADNTSPNHRKVQRKLKNIDITLLIYIVQVQNEQKVIFQRHVFESLLNFCFVKC